LYALEIRQNYHRPELNNEGTGYFNIISLIAKFLNVSVYSRRRTLGEKEYYTYKIMCASLPSRLAVISYFMKFPLQSSKRNDFDS
jgi:hypothetical protein